MLHFTVTINFDDGEEIEKEFQFPTLGDLGDFLNKEFPGAFSFVVVRSCTHA